MWCKSSCQAGRLERPKGQFSARVYQLVRHYSGASERNFQHAPVPLRFRANDVFGELMLVFDTRHAFSNVVLASIDYTS